MVIGVPGMRGTLLPRGRAFAILDISLRLNVGENRPGAAVRADVFAREHDHRGLRGVVSAVELASHLDPGADGLSGGLADGHLRGVEW